MTTELTIDQRFDLLEKAIKEKRICRHTWRTQTGKSCLISALAPEKNITDQNSESFDSALPFMPRWNKILTICLNDWGTRERWEKLITRYAKVIRSVSLRFDPSTWQKLYYAFIVSTLEKITEDKRLPAVCSEILTELKNNKESIISYKKCGELRDTLGASYNAKFFNTFEKRVFRCFEEALRALSDVNGEAEILNEFLYAALRALVVVIKSVNSEQNEYESKIVDDDFYEKDAADVVFTWFLDSAELLATQKAAQ